MYYRTFSLNLAPPPTIETDFSLSFPPSSAFNLPLPPSTSLCRRRSPIQSELCCTRTNPMRCNRSSSSTEQTAVVFLSPVLQSNICRTASGTRMFVQYCPAGAIDQHSPRRFRMAGSHQAFRVLSGFHRLGTLLEAEGGRLLRYAEKLPLVPVIYSVNMLKGDKGVGAPQNQPSQQVRKEGVPRGGLGPRPRRVP